MHAIVARSALSPNVTRLVVAAPRIAQVRRPGQFVIVRRGPGAERIPLTIADADPAAGTISLVIQAVGASTGDLVALAPGDAIADVAGPLGTPTDLLTAGHAVCVGGGVGTAVVHPIAAGLAAAGARVTSIIGGRSAPWVIYADELARYGATVVCTDDGTLGRHGLVTDALREMLDTGDVDRVYAVGPVPMMRAAGALAAEHGVPVVVSLNAIMVDGTGMCGGCRVVVGGETRYACVDGPEFDGAAVDFGLLADRLATYRSFEQAATQRRACRLAGRIPEADPADRAAAAPAPAEARS